MKILLVFFLILTACSAESFPDCCIGTDALRRDAPFSTTYLFNYKTGNTNIEAPSIDRFLRIISQPDILTLKNAASTDQLIANGLVSGQILGLQGPAREATVEITDRDGNILSKTESPNQNFFYNSLGRVPDFLNNLGTGDEGTFTFFNAPPGDLYVKVIKGGRGNGRLAAFPSAVSVTTIPALPVYPATVSILGVVSNGSGLDDISSATVSFFGKKEKVDTNNTGLFILPDEFGLPTQGEFLIRLSAPNFSSRQTVLQFDTELGRVLARLQAFDPLTADQLVVYSDEHISQLTASVGLAIDSSWGVIIGRAKKEDGTGQRDVVIIPLDSNGNTLAIKNGERRLFYFNGAQDVNDSGGGIGIPLDSTLTATSDDSRFILFIDNCDPTQEFFFNSYGIIPSIPETLSSGRTLTHCDPGNIVVQDITQLGIPVEQNPPRPPLITVPIESKVTDENGTPILDTEITIIGSPDPTITIDTEDNELHKISVGNNGDAFPILANSRYTLRTALDENFIPSYQTIFSGTQGGARDLTLLSTAVSAHCAPSGNINFFGTVRDVGLLSPARAGRVVDGISLKVVIEDGTEVGRVVYPGAETETSLSGEFAVCDLPGTGFYQIQVTTEESSGAIMVQSYPDGVHVITMNVNKPITKEVALSGQALSLFGFESNATLPLGNTNISVLGSKNKFSTDTSGDFNLSLGSKGTYILRLEKEGYLPAYNYQVETPVLVNRLSVPPLWSLSKNELGTLTTATGVSTSPQNSTFAGQVVIRGFSSDPEISATITPSADFMFNGFFNEDLHPDLMTFSKTGETNIFFGDGLGGLTAKTPVCPNLLSPPDDLNQIDFNLDGRPDLLAISNEEIHIYSGNRDGCFEQVQIFSADQLGGIPKAFSLTELTDDNFLDILLVTDGSTPLVQLENRRDGLFDLLRLGGVCGSNPVSVVARQNNARDLLDIIILDTVRGVCEITYNGDDSARATIDLILPEPLTPAGLQSVNVLFLDSDGTADIFVLHDLGGAYFTSLPLDGDEEEDIASSAPLLRSFTRETPFSVKTHNFVDINRDNRLDLIVGGAEGLQLLLGNGDGSFGTPSLISSDNTSVLTLSDLTEDGKIDLIAQQQSNLNLFLGEDTPKENIKISVKDYNGLGLGNIFYLDEAGKISKTADKTTSNGRFIVFNIPPGETLVQVAEGGSGNSYVTAFPESLSYLNLNINPIIPSTIILSGQIINPSAGPTAGIPVDDIKITPLGLGKQAVSKNIPANPEIAGDFERKGVFEIELGATSEYIIQLDP